MNLPSSHEEGRRRWHHGGGRRRRAGLEPGTCRPQGRLYESCLPPRWRRSDSGRSAGIMPACYNAAKMAALRSFVSFAQAFGEALHFSFQLEVLERS